MTLMLKQEDRVVIPSTIIHRGNSVPSVFGERIILDEGSMTEKWDHPIFRAVVKYLFAPIEGKNEFSNIERNLDDFLSVSYMKTAAEQTDGMDFNEEEYRKHINFVWTELQALTLGDLLKGAKEHIKISSFGSEKSTAIDATIRLMPGEGKEQLTQRLSNISNEDEQEAWEKMVGFRIKHSKLIEVANAKREQRVYIDFIKNLEEHMEHVTIKHYVDIQNAAKEFGLGSKGIQEAPPRDTKMFIDIEIDFRSMFEDEMRRDDILEGIPTNEWLEPIPKKKKQTGEEEDEQTSYVPNEEEMEHVYGKEELGDIGKAEEPYSKWDIDGYYPKIITGEDTDRELTNDEERLWDEIIEVIKNYVPELQEYEEEEVSEEMRDLQEGMDIAGERTGEKTPIEEEQIYDKRPEAVSREGEKLDDTEWTPESDEDEDIEDKDWQKDLTKEHLELVRQAVFWQKKNNLSISEWQVDIAVYMNRTIFDEKASAEAKKKEIVHAPMGTLSKDKRLFKQDPRENTIPELDLFSAYNVDGSKIHNSLRTALNPNNGVILKMTIAGFLDKEDKPEGDSDEDKIWKNKVYGVFYLQNIEIQYKVQWGYSGVVSPKTTKVGTPTTRRGSWAQVPKTPSRSEQVGRGEDRPHLPNVIQPGESTQQIAEDIDPDTGKQRWTNPDTGLYPRKEVKYKPGFYTREKRGALESGGSVRGEYGQPKYVVLMGYLRKQFPKVREMMENA